jgi:hypothetical protein
MESVVREGGHSGLVLEIREYYFRALPQSGLDKTAFHQLVG